MPSQKRLREDTLEDILDRLQVVEEEAKKLKNDNISLQKDVTDLRKDNLLLKDRNSNLQSRVTSLEKSRHEAALIHLSLCITDRDRCELDLKNFRNQYPNESVINADPILHARLLELITAKTEAWYAYFRAYDAAHPKTLEDVLWVVAKAGFVKEVAPLMNISKVTRNCIHLQPIMMNVKNRRGETQLHHCVRGLPFRKGLIRSRVERLLSIRNIDVNVKDKYEWTPLHLALKNYHIEIARLLIENGANVNEGNNDGETPLHLAAKEGHIDILHLLVENGSERLLSIRNIDVNVKDKCERTPLHFAAENGHVEIARLLLQNGADVNAKNNNDTTPLHLVADFGHVDILHLLVENGSDLEAEDDSGRRALHKSAMWGRLPIVKELVTRYHVDINSRDNLGNTALTLARDKNYPKFAEIAEIAAFLEANGGVE
jgi:ankyrin repeat protein